MKVIDLLNKIANDEELPKKIKYDNLVYEYLEQYNYKNELQINYYSVDNETDFFNNVFCYSLNDEVEIIEEDKKIRKLDFLEENTFSKRQNEMASEDRRLLDSNFRELGNKINEIIDEINKLKEGK